MKNNKKIISIFGILIGIFAFMFISNIYASSTSITASKNIAEVGDTITVNVNVDGAATWQLQASSSGVVTTSKSFVRSDDGIENVSKTVGSLTLKPDKVGTIVVKLAGNAYSSSNAPIPVNSSITIQVKEKTQPTTPSAPATNTNNNNNNTQTNKATTANNNTPNNNKAAKNNNAYLSKLQVNQEGLTPNFNKNKTSYAITVGENVDSLKVTATPEASTSKVSVTGNTNLKNGDNKVYVTVIAQDGTKKVYTITVTKTGDPVKANSYLESLIVENATMSPEFSKEILEYDCGTVGASVENLKILAFGENENVNIEIIGNDKLVEGENTITVKVTSEDGTTTKEYVIKVKKDSSLVEENKIEEINSLQDTDNDNKIIAFFKDLWRRIKANWLICLMYIVIIVEFIEIVYLYRHQEKKVKKEKGPRKNEVSKTTEKNMTLDKEFKQNRKLKRKLENNNNVNNDLSDSDNKKRSGREKFDNND